MSVGCEELVEFSSRARWLTIIIIGELCHRANTIFTHTLSSGVVPPSFKRAAITPVSESGDWSVPSNYRPISLPSVISKVLERIIRKQVSSFIDKKGFLNSTQHGFRSGRSC